MAYKIVVDGPNASGKTNFLRLLRGQPFTDIHEQTIGLDFISFEFNNKKFHIFEIAGG